MKDNNLENTKLECIEDTTKNIISWYPFEKQSSILEVSTKSNQITKELCKNGNKVISISEQEIDKINEKFDYITLIGLEQIACDLQEILKKVKKLLKTNGKLLIVFDNKYSLKTLSNDKGVKKIFDDNNKMYTLDEVEEKLNLVGFTNKKIYYPLTDSKFTNIIFTDDRKISKADIERNIILNDEDTIKFFEQNILLNVLIEENKDLKYYSNSFFLEVFNGEYIENNIKLVAFSNMRKEKYKIITIMKKDFVYKYPDNIISQKHIDNIKNNIEIMTKNNIKTLDTYDNEKIISKYVSNDTLDKYIINLLKKDKKQAIELIIRFKEYLYNNLISECIESNVFDKYNINYDKELIKQMKFTKYGLWDLIFQNCFYINNDFYFYDQEWMEENIPLDFILYRSIKYFSEIRNYIDIQELYDILNISYEKTKLFDKLDDKIQEDITNKEIWKRQFNGKTIDEIKIQKAKDNQKIEMLNTEIENKNNEISRLKVELENKNNEINIIYNSKSWKLTEPLRCVRKKCRKFLGGKSE